MKQTEHKFYDIERDGVTQGLLQQFMDCREKARLFLQGWTLKETNLGLTFGTIVHAALKELYSGIQRRTPRKLPSNDAIQYATQTAARLWRMEHPTATPLAFQHLETSLLFAERVLPVYFRYWQKDVAIAWTSLEQSFAIPYTLPDGRRTILRGRRDGDYRDAQSLWLFETKTKSLIVEQDLVDHLPLDLQNNFYLYGLRRERQQLPKGVLYNIIRRPLLRQGKDETLQQFAFRCAKDIEERPDFYFLRLEISVTEKELDRWEAEFADLMKDFYDWWQGKSGHYRNSGMCETKYGRCQFLHICAAKRMSFYYQRKVVFRELEDY